jgi:beta-lactamase class A
VAVLDDVEHGRLGLDQKVHVTPQEAVRGSVENAALWRTPVDRSVRELLELSMVRSDNTSSDALLRLAGGPAAVTRDLAALGFGGIVIRQPVRAFMASPGRPHANTASAVAVAQLLSGIQKGEVLQPAGREMVLGFMSQATTGRNRIRAGLPPGTPVGDKSGTGPAGTATNDVGIVTLPGGQGHLALAVFVVGSTRPLEAQEKVIAAVARAAYDAYANQPRL